METIRLIEIYEMVLERLRYIDRFDDINLFMCWILRYLRDEACEISWEEMDYVKRDIYSRPREEYGAVEYVSQSEIDEMLCSLFKSNDFCGRETFLINRIKQLKDLINKINELKETLC
jgi:hypothetical protein